MRFKTDENLPVEVAEFLRRQGHDALSVGEQSLAGAADPIVAGASGRVRNTMHRVVDVRPLDDYQLDVTFEDGMHGVTSLKDRLFGPVFEPLRDPNLFRQVRVDEFGAVCWPNGADLAPDALYDR